MDQKKQPTPQVAHQIAEQANRVAAALDALMIAASADVGSEAVLAGAISSLARLMTELTYMEVAGIDSGHKLDAAGVTTMNRLGEKIVRELHAEAVRIMQENGCKIMGVDMIGKTAQDN